mmetsp:Transcript_30425/g.96009  ORF Transcript_30425/g.96009 Transcript_30425/m.96009 type:complete len:306 (-) Transcript_30425:247-1164(-)
MHLLSRRLLLRATASAAALFTSAATVVPPALAVQANSELPPVPTLAALANSDLPQFVTLSPTGDHMPLIGLGTWESAPGEVGSAVTAALDAGCTHIDCAAAYRNEKEVGEALAASGRPRKSLFLTSKLWNDRRRPQDVRDALSTTLSRLGTDYLDLYLVHWPVVWARDSVMKPDEGASLRECWQTLEALVDEGKVRNIGVSNMKQSELEELLSFARIRPSVNQIELHPRLPQAAARGVLPAAQRGRHCVLATRSWQRQEGRAAGEPDRDGHRAGAWRIGSECAAAVEPRAQRCCYPKIRQSHAHR